MSVTCNRCGQIWARDPALEVACPKCKAAIGKGCQRPSNHAGNFTAIHKERLRLAFDLGFDLPCPAGPRVKKLKPSKNVAPRKEEVITAPSLWHVA